MLNSSWITWCISPSRVPRVHSKATGTHIRFRQADLYPISLHPGALGTSTQQADWRSTNGKKKTDSCEEATQLKSLRKGFCLKTTGQQGMLLSSTARKDLALFPIKTLNDHSKARYIKAFGHNSSSRFRRSDVNTPQLLTFAVDKV